MTIFTAPYPKALRRFTIKVKKCENQSKRENNLGYYINPYR